MDDIKRFVERIFPLYRSICSPDLDIALERIRDEFIPELVIEEYPTGEEAWTWTLPQKWTLSEGFIEENGKLIIHTKDEPLCVWSGSLPIDCEIGYEELIQHIYSEPKRPDLLCWYFRYYGKLDWGFNLPHNLVSKLNPKSTYRVKVDSKYYDDFFKVGYARIQGKSNKTILITSDICHPYQCNDSLSGAAVAFKLYQKLKASNPHYSYLFTFVPETIGTIAFLSRNENLIPDIVYHIYSEFWGNEGAVRLQKSLKGNSRLDEIAEDVLKESFQEDFQVLPFRKGGITNDELVTAMPGLFIPSIALNRGMFPEYHSHRDIPENLNYQNIEEGYQILEKILERLDQETDIDFSEEKGATPIRKNLNVREHSEDFVPEPLFKGPVFLSQYDLWVDWRTHPELNSALDLIMASLDGKNSVSDIAAFTKLPFETIQDYILQFEAKGLVSKKVGAIS